MALNSPFPFTYAGRCESRKHGKAKLAQFFQTHGLTWRNNEYEYECDLDGSFNKVNCKIDKNLCGCVDEFNNWIQDYNDNKVLKNDFNCQCARDKLKNPDNGLICDDHGNYQHIQRFDELEFCVDTDGFQTTPSYPNPGHTDGVI